MAASTASPRPYPTSIEEFDADERISFSKVSQKFILESAGGEEFEFDDVLKRWIPVVDEALLQQQRQAYSVQGVDESAPVERPSEKRKKAKEDEEEEEIGGRLVTKKKAKIKPSKDKAERAPKKNSAIYVTKLPLDATSEEIHDKFSRYGLIAEEIDSGAPRIKMYNDDDGKFKGDALIVYFRPESVKLAIDMLDDCELRLGDSLKMKVVEADYSFKSQKNEDGEQVSQEQKKPNNAQTSRDRAKVIARTQKLNSKLADWSSDEEISAIPTSHRPPSPSLNTPPVVIASTHGTTVLLKNMFTLDELQSDPDALDDITSDIRSECAKLGTLLSLKVYEHDPEGGASVVFKDREAAEKCVALMEGRAFGGARVSARIVEKDENSVPGKGRRKTKRTIEDGEEEERLERFGEWLEEGEKEGEVDRDGDVAFAGDQ